MIRTETRIVVDDNNAIMVAGGFGHYEYTIKDIWYDDDQATVAVTLPEVDALGLTFVGGAPKDMIINESIKPQMRRRIERWIGDLERLKEALDKDVILMSEINPRVVQSPEEKKAVADFWNKQELEFKAPTDMVEEGWVTVKVPGIAEVPRPRDIK